MVLSNSSPIQLWVNGQETFNEKDVCGMTKVCWCQPFESLDDISIIFNDTLNYDAELQIFDTNDNLLTTVGLFDRTSTVSGYQYKISFTAQGNGIFNSQIFFKINKLVINTITVEIPVYNFEFESDMDGWFNTIDGINPDSTSLPIWEHSTDDGGSIVVNQGNSMSTAFSVLRRSGITLPSETSFIRLKYRINYPPNNAGLNLSFAILDSGNAYVVDSPFALTPTPSSASEQIFIYGVVNPAIWSNADAFLLNVSATSIPSDNLDVIHINSIEVYTESYEYETVRTELAKSDCISIKESHPCTLLIDYSNNSFFDGIHYEDQSPNMNFNIRIPAIFFHPENTKESEDIELSDNRIVRLYDKIEEKRLLEIGFMPHYMHRKLLLALSHDFVTIDELDWLIRDEYKKNEGNKHYPLKTASVLLTDKNFIKENQL